jgi:hypothetical protein
MKKLAVALLLSLFALHASAATTWSNGAWLFGGPGSTVIATCSTGTESAPTLATQGISLANLAGFVVHAETAGTMTAGGLLKAYLYNAETGSWISAPDLDLTVQALAKQSFSGFTVTAPAGRIAYVPSGVGVAVTIYIVGTAR